MLSCLFFRENEHLIKSVGETLNEDRRGLPSGPVVKTLHFHCKAHGFDLWLGNRVQPKKIKIN